MYLPEPGIEPMSSVFIDECTKIHKMDEIYMFQKKTGWIIYIAQMHSSRTEYSLSIQEQQQKH